MSEITPEQMRDAAQVLIAIGVELQYAVERFPPFNSAHEGWAVIHEELDELWEHVRANTGRGIEARREAMQIATMAVRYIVDLSE